MKNIWTQHLGRSNHGDRDKETTFTRLLHSLVKPEIDMEQAAGSTLLLSGDVLLGEVSYSFADNGKHDADRQSENPLLFSNDGIATSFATETEIAVWTAESQKKYELGLQSAEKDYVKLLMTESGRLFLRYEVVGEETFEMNVDSENDAVQIIEEDNSTTEQLYPDNPELKWIKISIL